MEHTGLFLIFAKHKWKLLVCALQKSSVTAKNSPPDCFLNAASSPVFIILHKKDTVKVSFCVVEHTGLEPVTPTLPVLCAPSCANAPNIQYNTKREGECQVFFEKNKKTIDLPGTL